VRCLIQSRELGTAGFVAEIDSLCGVYATAMRADPAQLPGRRAIMERHAQQAGFRAIAVTAPAACDSSIIAFGYGFSGAGGQWWHDIVRSALTAKTGATVASAWLDSSMEIAELHVHPDFQRRGIGRSLLLGLTDGRSEHTTVLSTQDDNGPARRLYRSVGFADLLTGFSFPGGGPPYTIMAAVLPLLLAGRAGGASSRSRRRAVRQPLADSPEIE
jgi:ribosomal protein S18 acetylase RimI-like enzyme